MFEIGIFAFILFAMGYWATLFIMGRRDDVLHGQFVEVEPELIPAASGAPVAFLQPISPFVRKAAPVPPAATAAVAPVVEQAAAEPPSSEPDTASAPAATTPNADAWESLFASIKQELKNAAQI
jgi:hypothetical protein